MKHLRHTLLPLLLACAALGQNIDTLPAILGSAVDKANDKILIRDASVSAGAGALRSMTLAEMANVPGLFATSEPVLGNPAANGSVLSSTTGGVRSWTALEKVFYATRYGASPSATAAANVIAIQAALDAANTAGGGMVIIDQAGDYLVSSLLTIYGNTHLKMVPGSALKKSGSAFGEVLRNYGATSGVVDENITLEGVRVKCNNLSIRDSTISGVASEVCLYRVKNLTIRDFQIRDLVSSLFGLQINSWENLFIGNIHFEGAKDGLHLGPGRHGRVIGLRGDTDDDLLAINAHDWWSSNPTTGDITDLTIERMDAQGGIRLMTGAWASWVSGQQYYAGERVTHLGRVYVSCGSQVLRTASVAPTHATAGLIVTGADNIPWRYEYTGAALTTNIRNVVFQDCRFSSHAILRDSTNAAVGAHRGVTPGTEGNDEISGLVFANCVFDYAVPNAAITVGQGRMKDLTMRSCEFRGSAGTTINSQTAYPIPADFAAAQTSLFIFEGCRWLATGASPAIMAGTLPDNWTVRVSGMGNSPISGLFVSANGISADNFDLPVRIDQVTGTAGDRAKLRLTTGTILPGWYVYSRNRWEAETPTMESWFEDRLLMPSYYLATGTAATAAVTDGGMFVLNSGSTAGGFALARLSKKTAWHESASTNFSVPFVISGNGQIGAKNGGAVRVLYGVAIGYNSGFVANGSVLASPFSEKGVGIEWAQEGGMGNQKVRIIGHNGTVAVNSAWFDLGVAPNYVNDFYWELYNDGAGTYRLYIPTPGSALTNRRPFLPQTASCTLTGGPTGTGATGSNTGIWVVATGDNTTTPAGSDIYAYLSFPKIRFPRF